MHHHVDSCDAIDWTIPASDSVKTRGVKTGRTACLRSGSHSSLIRPLIIIMLSRASSLIGLVLLALCVSSALAHDFKGSNTIELTAGNYEELVGDITYCNWVNFARTQNFRPCRRLMEGYTSLHTSHRGAVSVLKSQ